jgi:hypothetical protein
MRCVVLTCEWVEDQEAAAGVGADCSNQNYWWVYAKPLGSGLPEQPRWQTIASIPTCAYLDDRLSSLGLARLTPAEAKERIEWAGKCFPDAASQSYLNFIAHLADDKGAPCPEYPVMGLATQNADGSWSYSNPEHWDAPTDHTAPCSYPWSYGFIAGALPTT